jgi:hypothetical protein
MSTRTRSRSKRLQSAARERVQSVDSNFAWPLRLAACGYSAKTREASRSTSGATTG